MFHSSISMPSFAPFSPSYICPFHNMAFIMETFDFQANKKLLLVISPEHSTHFNAQWSCDTEKTTNVATAQH